MSIISLSCLNHVALHTNWGATVKVWHVAGPPLQEVSMRFPSFIMAAAFGIAVSGPALSNKALAADLQPIQSQGIDLGNVAGDAYYTVEQDGFHVVATFATRDGGSTPVRFQAVLAPGQAVTFSTPRGAGEQPVSFSIKRQNERVIVAKTELTN
jgi:hypothetical protein